MARNDSERRRSDGGNGTGIPMPFLDDMPDTARTFFDRSAELQSEFLNLWSHRAQAWLNWPKQVMACKEPGDLTDAQSRFMTTMQRHYRDYFDSVLKDSLIRAKDLSGPDNSGPETSRDRDHSETHRKAA